MSVWCRIGQRQFYQHAGARAFMDPKLSQEQLLTDAGTLKTTVGIENASMTLTFANRMGECRDRFAVPPLGEIVFVYDDAAPQFEGAFTQIDLTPADGKVTVQA